MLYPLSYRRSATAYRRGLASRKCTAAESRYPDEGGEIAFREYYNLKRDPWQLVNVLRDGRPRNDPDVTALHERLTADRTCADATCP